MLKMIKSPQSNTQSTIRLRELVTLDHQRLQCKGCRSQFNERSGSSFNFLEYSIDLVILIVRWRLRYKLSLGAPSEMRLARGIELTYESA